jgi:hypothetical protein
VTVALNAVPNGALTSAICGVPAVAEIEVLSKMSVTGILNGLLAAPAEVMMTFPLKVVAARLVVTTETVIVLLDVFPEPGLAISQFWSVVTVKSKLVPVEVTDSVCEFGVVPTAPVKVSEGAVEPALGVGGGGAIKF